MEMKEAERVVIARPIASRPSCSGFRTFTELLTKSVNVSPQKICPETVVVSAIKPKTLRFRPSGNGEASAMFSRGQVSANGNENKLEDNRNYVVYKPKAKVVSKATISALANMLQGKVSVDLQEPLKQTEVFLQTWSRQNRQNHPCPNLVQKVPNFSELNARSSETSRGDRSCLDGYNWRKYGQKQVKGSECPRSYYKCTHLNCPVKKKVERSLDGQISEIVYQGEHNHPKPCLPPRRSSSSASQKLGFASSGSPHQEPLVYSQWRNRHQFSGRNDWSEGRVENRKGVSVSANSEFAVPRAGNSAAGASDSCCRSGECDETSKGFDGEIDDPKSKRRKNEHQTSETGVSEDCSGEPRGQSQGSVDSDALEDGFRWRKYGQKVVGGNPFPRSYYRCTSTNCRARKHVERASDDPRAFITTYEGKHNHQMPFRPPSSLLEHSK
ncbi:PREDICTED: WRKY transcription factor 44-like [Tarenaya hassleriana]|uniref:WRKY transcription factor 44-like n=1 Tax=Tarenaya hassleriana TaxID=28532 RepID=UPI00053C66B9|nr:PREDICTED: WRKY transcription factor 44-like [Tarenaya hassleriana]